MTLLNDTTSIRSLLATRRSASAKAMGEPGPTPEQLKEILTAAVRVPTTVSSRPGASSCSKARREASSASVSWRAGKLHPEHGQEMLDFAARMFLRAPVVVAVVSTARQHPKIPVWEQTLSSAAVCQKS